MIYLNGQFISPDDAKIATTDRGFLLSDGLFETIPIYQGKPFALEKHWDRLKKSADYLELPLTLTYENLKNKIADLVNLNSMEEIRATLRLTITRGIGARGLNYPEVIEPTVLMAIFPAITQPISSAKIAISSIRRNEYSPLTNIKSLAYLDNVLARREAVKLGFDEAIILNTKGHVAEASAANIFIVTKESILATPRLNDGALSGITRDIVLTLATKHHIPTEERMIHPDELFDAKEIFITNSIIEIQAIKQIQHKTLACDAGANPITCMLKTSYSELIKFSTILTK